MTRLPQDLAEAAAILQALQATPTLSLDELRLCKLLRAHLGAPLPDAKRWRYLQLRLKQFDKVLQGPLSAADEGEFLHLGAQADGEALETMGAVLARSASEPPQAPSWIWSRGWYDWMQRCNPMVPDEYFAALTETRTVPAFMEEHLGSAGGFVWLRTGSPFFDAPYGPSDVVTFVDHALPRVRSPFVLVTTDGDRCMPSQLPFGVAEALLDSPHLVRWYTQNWDGTCAHPKLRAVPIGLDLHTQALPDEKVAMLQHAQQHAQPWDTRPLAVAIDGMGHTHPDRQRMLKMLQSCPHVRLQTERLPFPEAMEHYAACRFAVSPRGNGWDCHRTWELLLLGTVPIVRRGPLDSLYRGLPVVVVEDWDAVRDANNLRRWSAEMMPLTRTHGSEWLQRERWVPAPKL